MKIEKLTENKIRIIIDANELTEKNVNINSLVKNTDTAHKLFTSMLEEAKKQVGFVVDDSKLLVEAYSTSDGLFVITFTKFNTIKETSSQVNLEQTNSNRKVQFKRKVPKNNYKNVIYQFENFEEFCNFCTYINSSKGSDLKGFAKKISLYEYNSLYYLVFTNIDTDYPLAKFFYGSISEFAKIVNTSNVFKSKLDEYGHVIFKTNALKNGIKYFAF